MNIKETKELDEAMALCSDLFNKGESQELEDGHPVYNNFEPGSQPKIIDGNNNTVESQNNNNSVILKLLKMLEEKDKQIKEKDLQITRLTEKLIK